MLGLVRCKFNFCQYSMGFLFVKLITCKVILPVGSTFMGQKCGPFLKVRIDSLPHRKWKETKQQPGTAGPATCLAVA